MSAPGSAPDGQSNDIFVHLYAGNLIPLKIIVASLTWVLHDYFVTLKDEVEHFWGSKPSFGKYMFFFLRYYTIVLLILYALQIHTFSIGGVPTLERCMAIDPITRVAGAISLWSVEIIMQLRIYILFNGNKKIAILNGVLFGISVVVFCFILAFNTIRRFGMISHYMNMPLPGCPPINGTNGAIQWAQWLPATAFEIILLAFVIYKAIALSSKDKVSKNNILLAGVMIHENVAYFALITVLLIITNLMVIPRSPIPWFSLGPFHASIGIFTCRMMIHLRKISTESFEHGVKVSRPPDLEVYGSRLETPPLVDASDHSGGSVSSEENSGHEIQCPYDEENMIGNRMLVSRSSWPNYHEAGPSRLH